MNNKQTTKVAIVIPTWQADRVIGACLESIKKQSYDNIETIIVDNMSRDGTVTVSKRYNARIISSQANRSLARNIGFESSDASLFLFIDADQILTENVVEKCVRAFDSGADVVFVPEVSTALSTNLSKAMTTMRSIRSLQFPRSFSRDTLALIGGFDPDLDGGEDFDIYLRARKTGASEAIITSPIFHHERSLAAFLARKSQDATNLQLLFRKHGKKVLLRYSVVGFDFLKDLFIIALQSPKNGITILGIRLLMVLSAMIGIFGS